MPVMALVKTADGPVHWAFVCGCAVAAAVGRDGSLPATVKADFPPSSTATVLMAHAKAVPRERVDMLGIAL
eukprot:3209680-Amphidinium_carterae.1